MSIYEDFYETWCVLKNTTKRIDEYEIQLDDWAKRHNELILRHSEKIEELEKCKKDLRDLRSDLAEKWQEIRNFKDAYGAFRLRNAELCKQLTQKNLQIAELLEAKDAPEPDVTFDPQPE